MKCPRCQAENLDQSKFCAECGSRIFPSGEAFFSKTKTLEIGYRVLSKGKIFAGKYAIIGEIGRGGMGVVYKAEDIRLRRMVAIKFLPPELGVYSEAKERFIREAQSAAALSHPNICTIHEVEEVDGQLYIAMEFVSGESLRKKVAKGPMAADALVDIAVQVADGLETAHQHGIIHRDIKSANIMVTEKGQAKVMDFGLAKVMGQEQLTREAVTIGTVAYMSPEQVQGEELDQCTDLWSFGVVLYEMLTGELPFRGDTESIILHSVVEAEPKPLRQLRPDIPVELQKIIDRALKKNREDRYSSAAEMARDLRKYLETCRAEEAGLFNVRSLAKRVKKPAYFIPAAAILLAVAALAYWRIDHSARVRWARQVALLEIQRLYQDSKFTEAFKIASRAEKYIPKDPVLQEILSQIVGELTMDSDPPGASVYMREYSAKEAPWEFVGKTPLRAVRKAVSLWRIKMEKPGYEPNETWFPTSSIALNNTVLGATPLKMKLDPQGSLPAGMVRVQGALEYESAPDIGLIKDKAVPVGFPEYFLDKFEVTNKQYKAFVDGGGYRERKFWKYSFVHNGRTISWEAAMKLFVDKTGVPAPSGWELGDYPQGQDDFPVSGVSWYEAAAYAEFAGKALPTVYHWAWPLGSPQLFSAGLLPLSNFWGKGLAPVGMSQAVSWAGTYDQCGNVKEWCWNAMGNKRLILGGAWDQPNYMGFDAEAFEPFRRDGTFGFRCMKYIGRPELAAKALDPIPEPVPIDFSKLAPCSDEVFSVIRGVYSYSKTDLEPIIEFRRQYSEYAMLEKASFWDAYRRYRVSAYIFLPRKFKPPFQTVFYFPGAGAWAIKSFSDFPLIDGEIHFKNGRALVFPVMRGMFERKDQIPSLQGAWTNQEDREFQISRFQDLARCIDYIETRPADFRADKLAYHGLSIGAKFAPVFGALETRLRAIVAVGGGADTNRNDPNFNYPEVDRFNFLPRVKIPFLLVDGKYDTYFPVETNLKVFMRLLGTPEKDKYLNLYDAGHIPLLPKSFKDILDFLDKYLGPPN